MSDPVLEVTGLTKRFGAEVAVDDLSLSVERGSALGIVGESGSGKTTAARVIAGLLRPDAGTVRFSGRERDPRARGRAARLERAKDVQMVFQNPYLSLDPRVSVWNCLDEEVRLHLGGGAATRAARVRALLDQVGLGDRESRAMPRQLSGGQRQRVAIARALATEPRLVILDEAVAALDVSTQAQILNLLADIRQEAAVSYLFVSHDLAVVRYVTDQLLVLYRGRTVERGRTADVLSSPQHAYTRLLLESVPRRGWDPTRIGDLRCALPQDDDVAPRARRRPRRVARARQLLRASPGEHRGPQHHGAPLTGR